MIWLKALNSLIEQIIQERKVFPSKNRTIYFRMKLRYVSGWNIFISYEVKLFHLLHEVFWFSHILK